MVRARWSGTPGGNPWQGQVGMTDEQLLTRFEAVRLPAGSFDHAAHVRVAWLCLGRYGFAEGQARYREGLRRFAERAGVPQKYHETITCALLLLIQDRMTEPDAPGTWSGFAERNADLLVWKGGPLFRHYPEEVLRSESARRRFELPDSGAPALPCVAPDGTDRLSVMRDRDVIPS